MEAEKSKYTRMWGFSSYRAGSPELRVVNRILDHIGPDPTTIAVFGVGCGKAVPHYFNAGHDITLIDIAANCLDADIRNLVNHNLNRIEFIEACLWMLPDFPMVDFGICVDVLEHIPTPMVAPVLGEIGSHTRRGFLQIALHDEGYGPEHIGEDLHLTVQPPEWWCPLLTTYFPGAGLDVYHQHGEKLNVVY